MWIMHTSNSKDLKNLLTQGLCECPSCIFVVLSQIPHSLLWNLTNQMYSTFIDIRFVYLCLSLHFELVSLKSPHKESQNNVENSGKLPSGTQGVEDVAYGWRDSEC